MSRNTYCYSYFNAGILQNYPDISEELKDAVQEEGKILIRIQEVFKTQLSATLLPIKTTFLKAMKKFILCFLIIIITCTVAVSQPDREYEARKKKATDEKALQKYIDDRVPVKGSGASQTQYRWEKTRERQEIEAQRKQVKDEKDAEDKRNEEANNRNAPSISVEQIARNVEEIRLRDLKEEELRPIMKEYFSQFDFLNTNEVNVLTRAASTYNWEKNGFITQPGNYLRYNEIKGTGNYDELRGLINGFRSITNKAVEALDMLNIRFPEHSKETDSLMLKIADFRYPDMELSPKCIQSFRKLSPRLSAKMLNSSGIWRDVSASLIEKIRVERQKNPVNTSEILQTQKELTQTVGNTLMIDYAENYLKEYLETLTASELLVIAEKKDVPPSLLALARGRSFYFNLIRNSDEEWKELLNANKNNNSIAEAFRKMEEMGSKGDLSSMFLLGLYLAKGTTIEDREKGELMKRNAKNLGYDPSWLWYWRGMGVR